MKIDFGTIDRTQFRVDEQILNGNIVYLIQPQNIGIQWTQENKIFRSSVWDFDGNLVSAGFPKFTNWGEKPEQFPVPETLKGATVMEKLDGSLLIVTRWKGHLILRTRGTVDASKLDNGFELEAFKTVAKSLIDTWDKNAGQTWGVSFLFEWLSPNQKIILNYGDQPQFALVGAVEHLTYDIWPQAALDIVAKQHNLIRPPSYTFSDVSDLLNQVELWKGKEGVCVYSYNNQLGPMIHKVKGAWYLVLHRMKETLSSFEKVVDVWYEQGEPSYQEFEKFIVDQFDFELWQQIRGESSHICDANKQVQKIINGFQVFVNQVLSHLGTRKEQAEKVLSSYGQTNRASFVFKILDGKELSKEDKKKLLWQVLKK